MGCRPEFGEKMLGAPLGTNEARSAVLAGFHEHPLAEHGGRQISLRSARLESLAKGREKSKCFRQARL